MGLGDHIICNGLTRSLIKEGKDYTMFVKPHNRKTVEFMYRDLQNLYFIDAYDADVTNYFNNNNKLLIRGYRKNDNCIGYEEWYGGETTNFYIR